MNRGWLLLTVTLIVVAVSAQLYTVNYYQGVINTLNQSNVRTSTSGIILLGNAWYGLTSDAAGEIDLLPSDLIFGAVNVVQSKTVSFYIVNVGKPMKANIFWDTPSWTPVSGNDLSLTWDLGESIIMTGEVKKVVVTLKLNVVLPTDIPSFTFKLKINGTVVGASS